MKSAWRSVEAGVRDPFNADEPWLDFVPGLSLVRAVNRGGSTLDIVLATAELAPGAGRVASWVVDAANAGRRANRTGRLVITAANPSASEVRAAEHMAGLGRNVELRNPTGARRSGGTSDLLVDGAAYDVYTPQTTSVNRIVSAIAHKNDQATGIVLDLSNTSITADDLPNLLYRVNNAGATNITDIVIIGN